MVTNVLVFCLFLMSPNPKIPPQNDLSAAIRQVGDNGDKLLRSYQYCVGNQEFLMYLTLWNLRINHMERAARENRLESFIDSEIEAISSDWNKKYALLPSPVKNCEKCIVYREYRHPFNPYFAYKDGMPVEETSHLSDQQMFEYIFVQNCVKLKFTIIDRIGWEKSHTLFLWYLRNTPKGDEEYEQATFGYSNRLQCLDCRRFNSRR